MKPSQKKSLIEFVSKRNNVSEGIVDLLFRKVLAQKIKKDPNFKKVAKELDDATKDAQDYFKQQEKEGYNVPDEVKKALGMK